MKFVNLIVLIVLFTLISACSESAESNTDTTETAQTEQPYFRFETADGRSGYRTADGDTVIRAGKYEMCFTDTFTYAAIVLKPDEGFLGIDKTGKVLYQVFAFDNGPDYLAEGFFRIQKDGKIGFADREGRIVIEPQFSCAHPFEGGKAQVSLNCTTLHEDEHTSWQSEEWFYIDKTGKRVE